MKGENIMMQELVLHNKKIKHILTNINKVIIGKNDVATLSLVALLAEGHVLLEDVPGVGKTMLVRALAKSLDCDFKRIQFTPDLLPSDITGVSIYNPQELEFEFRSGPVFGNIVLADEINRTSPKTQSSLLEGMEEKSVTVDGVTMKLPEPFFVMATQNPIEYEGTYPLPEAQLDRFILKLKMGYPSIEDEVDMLNRVMENSPIDEISAVMSKEELMSIREDIKGVYIARNIKRYMIELVNRTRNHPAIYLGVSPRGSIALMKASKAYAYIQGRDYVLPDDVKYLAEYVLSHRIILTPEANYENIKNEDMITSIVQDVNIPIQRDANE